jgi:hypothetical protein
VLNEGAAIAKGGAAKTAQRPAEIHLENKIVPHTSIVPNLPALHYGSNNP